MKIRTTLSVELMFTVSLALFKTLLFLCTNNNCSLGYLSLGAFHLSIGILHVFLVHSFPLWDVSLSIGIESDFRHTLLLWNLWPLNWNVGHFLCTSLH